MNKSQPQICIIGLWHQGCVAAACFADFGFDVIGVDTDTDKIAELAQGRAPLFEPGLDELLRKGIRKGHLQFTTIIPKSVAESPFVFLMMDTPVDENDYVNLNGLYEVVAQMAPHLRKGAVIWVTAQVPVGTCNEIHRRIREKNPTAEFGLAYSPENLRLGNAIQLFKHPALPVLGSDDKKTLDQLEKMFSVFKTKFIRMNLRSAEMTKHALNAFLATSVAFGNEFGNLCDEVGADAYEIAKALRSEPRIGPKAMLFPGLGFSGGTLARDMQTLRRLGTQYQLATHMLDGIWAANEWQNGLVVRKLEKVLGDLKDVSIAVLGLTYKAETSTLRRSVSLAIIADLVRRGAKISAHDPKADREEIKKHPEFVFYENPYDAVQGATALILITPWKDYESLDYGQIKKQMVMPLIFDTNNKLNPDELILQGFTYIGIGRGRQWEGIQ